jgi:flavin reductase (DIM6/NTAB) family NADH-FMN oxidoreductase RutF
MISKQSILDFEKPYRTHFVNSLAGYKQPVLISSMSAQKQVNLAIFNSLIHIGAHPPLFGILFRPSIVERHTLTNINEMNYFGLNYMDENHIKSMHQTSARYPDDVNEFNACGFHEEWIEDMPIPFVREAQINVLMKREEEIIIQSNQTHLIIASIEQVIVDESKISPDGFIQFDALQIVASQGLDTYCEVKKIDRFSYAKVDREITSI